MRRYNPSFLKKKKKLSVEEERDKRMKLDHDDTLFSYRKKIRCPNNGETFYHSYARVITKSTSHKLFTAWNSVNFSKVLVDSVGGHDEDM